MRKLLGSETKRLDFLQITQEEFYSCAEGEVNFFLVWYVFPFMTQVFLVL